MENIYFFSWFKWFVFALPWESLASGWWKRKVSPLCKETVCSGEVRRNDSQTTKKVWQPLKNHSPPKISKRFFFHTCHGAAKRHTRKNIRRWRSSWREAWTPAFMTFSSLGVFCFCDLCGSKPGEIGIHPQKSNIADENGHIKKKSPFPNHHFSIHVSFRGCKHDKYSNYFYILGSPHTIM